MNATYQPPSKKHWTGRKSESNEYIHQSIQLIDLFKTNTLDTTMAFIGYQCEEGVKRNQGRPGTKEGPNAIRDVLGKLPTHHPEVLLADCGDLIYHDRVDLPTYQKQFAGHISRLLKANAFPIALGGGHDMSYATFCGAHDAMHQEGKHFGIINFDAHLDLRSEAQATSGTPFKQLLDQFGDHIHYFAVGIQSSANTSRLFETAKATNTEYLLLEECTLHKLQETLDRIEKFTRTVDYLYITIDMDGFSSAFSPGVSAPSPFGLTPDFVLTLLHHLLKTGKVILVDVAETNPTFDVDQATARLAAKLIWEVIPHLKK